MTSIVADVLEIPGWIVAGVVALLHVYFLALEMFMWRGRARRVFGTKRAIAEVTANMAANQVCGVYQTLHVCSLAAWHGAGCGWWQRIDGLRVGGCVRGMRHVVWGWQGYYNGILAAGIVYGIILQDSNVCAAFLCGVFGAGVFGALTVSFRILFVQSVPALIAFVLLILGTKGALLPRVCVCFFCVCVFCVCVCVCVCGPVRACTCGPVRACTCGPVCVCVCVALCVVLCVGVCTRGSQALICSSSPMVLLTHQTCDAQTPQIQCGHSLSWPSPWPSPSRWVWWLAVASVPWPRRTAPLPRRQHALARAPPLRRVATLAWTTTPTPTPRPRSRLLRRRVLEGPPPQCRDLLHALPSLRKQCQLCVRRTEVGQARLVSTAATNTRTTQ